MSKQRHPGYIIGDHWLETAYSRICAGDNETETLADYGYVLADRGKSMSNCVSHDGSVPPYINECPECARLRAELAHANGLLNIEAHAREDWREEIDTLTAELQQAQDSLRLADKLIELYIWYRGVPTAVEESLREWRAGR